MMHLLAPLLAQLCCHVHRRCAAYRLSVQNDFVGRHSPCLQCGGGVRVGRVSLVRRPLPVPAVWWWGSSYQRSEKAHAKQNSTVLGSHTGFFLETRSEQLLNNRSNDNTPVSRQQQA